jgi:hypothetical protein
VWHHLRENTLCPLVWDSYGAIVEACTTARHFLINDPDRIRSIGKRDWACVSVSVDWHVSQSRSFRGL